MTRDYTRLPEMTRDYTRYQVRMPLRPRYVGEVTEISSTEPIAWRLNGVPLYSSAWAVWNRFIFSSYAARGHQGSYTSLWHYHLLCEPGQDCEARGAVMPPPEARAALAAAAATAAAAAAAAAATIVVVVAV